MISAAHSFTCNSGGSRAARSPALLSTDPLVLGLLTLPVGLETIPLIAGARGACEQLACLSPGFRHGIACMHA